MRRRRVLFVNGAEVRQLLVAMQKRLRTLSKRGIVLQMWSNNRLESISVHRAALSRALLELFKLLVVFKYLLSNILDFRQINLFFYNILIPRFFSLFYYSIGYLQHLIL